MLQMLEGVMGTKQTEQVRGGSIKPFAHRLMILEVSSQPVLKNTRQANYTHTALFSKRLLFGEEL